MEFNFKSPLNHYHCHFLLIYGTIFPCVCVFLRNTNVFFWNASLGLSVYLFLCLFTKYILKHMIALPEIIGTVNVMLCHCLKLEFIQHAEERLTLPTTKCNRPSKLVLLSEHCAYLLSIYVGSSTFSCHQPWLLCDPESPDDPAGVTIFHKLTMFLLLKGSAL